MKSTETTLVIMAAGIGSRFGGGIKQLAPVGPSGEIIMDYSICDAIEAGFDRILFIIRHDLEKDFREIIGNRLEARFPGKIDYAFQESDDLPIGFVKPAERKKPWGTGHAVLACKGILKTPALVINADDYYGKSAYRAMHDTLVTLQDTPEQLALCMPGFLVENTLSENGGVSRGVCSVDENGNLTRIVETHNIMMAKDGSAFVTVDGVDTLIPKNTFVSMNMWGITPAFLECLESEFVTFLTSIEGNELKAEFLLPTIVGKLIDEHRASVKVLPCSSRWFGVTYKEDKEAVQESIRALVRDGLYPSPLFQ